MITEVHIHLGIQRYQVHMKEKIKGRRSTKRNKSVEMKGLTLILLYLPFAFAFLIYISRQNSEFFRFIYLNFRFGRKF